jgi:fatty acid desaturase
MNAATPRQRAGSTTDFKELHRRLVAAGCFEYAPLRSVASLAVHLLAAGAIFVASARGPWWLAAPLFLAGSLVFYRIGWLMHDAAHGGVFASAARNRRFAAVCAGVLGEFPSGWRYGHSRHHAAPNVRGRDLDQADRWDPTRRYPGWLSAAIGLLLLSRFKGTYVPKTMLLIALRDGYFCYRHARASFARELAVSLASLLAQVGFFTALFGWKGPLLFVIHTWIGLIYLNLVFTGSHYDREAFDEATAPDIDFAELQIRTTRNYPPGALAAFLCGGIEYQLEHHLFPSMPRRGFPLAVAEVRAFCEARGLRYEVMPFRETLRRALQFHIDRPSTLPAAPPPADSPPRP